jgi:hypothetical protein
MNNPTPTWNGEVRQGGDTLRFAQRRAQVAEPVADMRRRLEAQFSREELAEVEAMRQRPDVDDDDVVLDLRARLIQRENPEMSYTEALAQVEAGEESENG